jgi:hypothetical protein
LAVGTPEALAGDLGADGACVVVVVAGRLGVEMGRVVGAGLAARSVLGLNPGTPEPRVPATLVAPNIQSSTSPGLGESPIGPSGL